MKFGMSYGRRRDWFCAKHVSASEKAHGVSCLWQEQAFSIAANLNAQKVVKRTKVLHGKVKSKLIDNLVEKWCIAAC